MLVARNFPTWVLVARNLPTWVLVAICCWCSVLGQENGMLTMLIISYDMLFQPVLIFAKCIFIF